MLPLNRVYERGDTPSRSDRFYQIGDEWYFAVRKGPDQGPYRSKDEARAALRVFIVEKLAEEKQAVRSEAKKGALKFFSY